MSPERARLEALGETLRRDSGLKVKHTGTGVLGLTVGRQVRVACHAQPWDGPLYFCVPRHDGGPCRILGRADQVMEVAGVVVRLVSTEDTEPK